MTDHPHQQRSPYYTPEQLDGDMSPGEDTTDGDFDDQPEPDEDDDLGEDDDGEDEPDETDDEQALPR